VVDDTIIENAEPDEYIVIDSLSVVLGSELAIEVKVDRLVDIVVLWMLFMVEVSFDAAILRVSLTAAVLLEVGEVVEGERIVKGVAVAEVPKGTGDTVIVLDVNVAEGIGNGRDKVSMIVAGSPGSPWSRRTDESPKASFGPDTTPPGRAVAVEKSTIMRAR
jgi:hypothetical protein